MQSSRIHLWVPPFVFLALGFCAAPIQATSGKLATDWKPCFQETGHNFECARVSVPLIHSRRQEEQRDPWKPMASIALARLPAADPAHRIGSLFLNPGGPGSSGVNFLVSVGPQLFTEEVRARYDLVGFDPRGVARSDALVCFRSLEELDPIPPRGNYPLSLKEIAARKASDGYFAELCDDRAAAIIDYMTTADVARDLDLLRQAVGDIKLNYAGLSYGTYLGVTYANLFPRKVGAVVIDGVVDPIAWATGRYGQRFTKPFSTRVRSDAGAQDTLNEFFRLCDNGSNCAFAGDSATRFAVLAESIRSQPLSIPLPDGGFLELTYDAFIVTTLLSLYQSFAWPEFADFLAGLEAFGPSEVTGARWSALFQYLGLEEEQPSIGQTIEGFYGAACGDTDNPARFIAWPFAAEITEARFGYFGPFWTWTSSVCAQWPGSMGSRYAGPFDKLTANPILVTNTLFDPATRYEGAVTVSNLLPNSRLLTVEGWGHTTLFLSQCATQAVSDYLVDSTLPSEGTVCQQDSVPFDGPFPVARRTQPPDAVSIPERRATKLPDEKARENRARVIRAIVPEAIRRAIRQVN